MGRPECTRSPQVVMRVPPFGMLSNETHCASAAPMAFTLATAVGVSRVYLGHHFPTDVAVGAMVGGGIGTGVAWAIRLTREL